MSPPTIKRFGWRRGRLDPRDRIFNLEESILQPWQLPKTVDLTSEMPPVLDQGDLGSCVSNAAASLLEHQQARQGEAEGKVTPSRLFIYYQARVRGGYPINEDTGAEIRDGIKVLAKDGGPPETDWPYDIGKFAQKPPAKAYTDATKYEALVYQKIIVNSPGAPMRTAIANHQPINFGFQVPDYFEDGSWDQAKTPLPLPDANTNFIGGHAVLAVGYDWSMTRFKVPVFHCRNSWGPDWGTDNGYFYVPFNLFDPWRGIADDLWILKQVT